MFALNVTKESRRKYQQQQQQHQYQYNREEKIAVRSKATKQTLYVELCVLCVFFKFVLQKKKIEPYYNELRLIPF